jgi:hypothetical protein
METQQLATTSPNRLGFSLKRLAESTDVTVAFLRLEIRRGRLKPIRLGRRVIITAEEVHRYLSAGKHGNER